MADPGSAPDPGPGLTIDDRCSPSTDPDWLRTVVDAARAHVQRPDLEVHLLLCDDEEIARLHGEYLEDPTPTDVITFVLDEDSVDLAVSVECARRVAREKGHAERAELALYVVHGVLHASGYDDHEENERAAMRVAERQVLDLLGLEFTPVDGSNS